MRAPTGTLLRAGVAIILGLAVVSCTDDAEPGTIESPSPTPSSSSASPTPSTPEAQIEATMQAYFAAANEMFETGDVTKIRSFSTSACPCRKVTRYVERVVTAGGEFQGARYEDPRIKVHDIDGESALAEATVVVPPYKVVDVDGKVIENSKGGTLHTDYSLVRSKEGEWIIGNALDLG